MRNLIDITDLSVDEINSILALAEDIIKNKKKYSEICHGKKLATLFFEPSTRTRLSFEAAMIELGGNVIGFSDPDNSSTSKGESLADTIKTVCCYADIIAMRHPKEGAPVVACAHNCVPIINAGDGGHCHPTQTLTDLLTIKREKHRLDNMTVGLCGDLKFGRTVHSLINALTRYSGIKFVLISPNELKIPGYIRRGVLEKNGIPYEETDSLENAIPNLDILYMTRIQGERFANKEEFLRLRDAFILDTEKMQLASESLSVMHPLPRVNEISTDVDSDPRACYFKQVLNGKYVRMALMLKLLEWKDCEAIHPGTQLRYDSTCTNPRCITSSERIPQQFKLCREGEDVYRCVYCESKLK